MCPREGRNCISATSVWGPALVVLHGGPDFDYDYLLPEFDRLAQRFRIIYYDQRGRGRSADGVPPDEVSLESEMDDLNHVRRHLGLESMALLGHSWGAVLAMEYASRHPERLTHLIPMNAAPASSRDINALRQHPGPHPASRRRPGDAIPLGDCRISCGDCQCRV
jgi:proline iminopeptidase